MTTTKLYGTKFLKSKVFNDPIHGHIELSSLSVKIIDTPQFQRLRDISQLGGVYYVFAGASSNRFEHCLGVAHLAKVFVNYLQENQPELNITEQDALCIELAGLCHDIGHGPFSHLYDGRFIPLMKKQKTLDGGKAIHSDEHEFSHEHASIGILDILIQENNLLPIFREHGLDEGDIQFVKELILGDKKEAPHGFEWKGRGVKTFLYDIVANKRNGIDVDKFDYFARDCHVLGLTKSFDALRLMRFARVFAVERFYSDKGTNFSQYEICFHVKEAWNIFELFHTRYALHKRAYQHRVSHAIELMIVEAFQLADPYILIPGKDNNLCTMSQCPNDLHAYWKLGEYLLRQIENTYSEDLGPARDLIHRIRKRDLFAFAGETIITPALRAKLIESGGYGEQNIKRSVLDLMETKSDELQLPPRDFFCQIVKIGYGKGNINPVSTFTAFYEPNKMDESSFNLRIDGDRSNEEVGWRVGVVPEDSVSRVIPREFEEVYIRFFTRNKEQAPIMKQIFLEWCKINSVVVSSLTPMKRTRHDDSV